MKTGKGICILLIFALLAAIPAAPAEEDAPRERELVRQLVTAYASEGQADEQALAGLAAIDPSLGDKWRRIIDLWKEPVAINAELPDGLPEDDSLCLVGLGFRLNPDGTMQEELKERLKVLLAASRKYPRALILCTGGATAWDNPEATEAGTMAEWLREQGVDPSRLIAEGQSRTTAQNAIFSIGILNRDYPGVREIAVVSSDYHVPAGVLLFGAEAILTDSGIRVTGNAAWMASGGRTAPMSPTGALVELAGDR